ncbi:MAG: VWA domain-containing protein, partial [bacterium]
MFLRFAYFELFYVLVPLFLLACAYRFTWYKIPLYIYPLGAGITKTNVITKGTHKTMLALLRSVILLVLIFLICRPQWVDEKSKINVEGIDIVIAMDISGSMRVFDDLKDRRSRIQVAKDEAIRFIEKRTNDPIGVVIFAKDALSRCPLTLDKKSLKEIIGSLELGFIDPEGTSLGSGLATAVNRLKNSKAKSRVIILLTDGKPEGEEKISPEEATKIAQEFGIKVYTIGIGSQTVSFIPGPAGYFRQVQTYFDKALLEHIARQTGGMHFHACNPQDMHAIYDKIDALEKTKLETSMFHNYYEAFLSIIWVLLLLVGCEFLLRFFVWRGV